MLPFPMFRPRQSRPHPQLPSASVQYLSVPATCARHLPRSARHSSTRDLASILPPVTSHESPITNSFRIRTSEKHAPNPFRIRTSKTQHLKPFRMNTSKKTGGGGPLMVNQKFVERFLSRTSTGNEESLATGGKRSFWSATNCGHSLDHRQLLARSVCSLTILWPLRVPRVFLR
jgi:hypothetical protein